MPKKDKIKDLLYVNTCNKFLRIIGEIELSQDLLTDSKKKHKQLGADLDEVDADLNWVKISIRRAMGILSKLRINN